jgi:uncharacterized protein YndB with AHSA1/START domain
MTIAPIRRSVRTKAPPTRAFEIFTGRMGRWWPRGRTVGQAPHEDIVVEPHVGGRWFERDAEGRETQWGEVLAWEPPHRVVLAWQLDGQKNYDPSLITEVEITFAPADGGTEVRLEHRNLERFRKAADTWAAAVARGWTEMLDVFAEFVDRDDGGT